MFLRLASHTSFPAKYLNDIIAEYVSEHCYVTLETLKIFPPLILNLQTSVEVKLWLGVSARVQGYTPGRTASTSNPPLPRIGHFSRFSLYDYKYLVRFYVHFIYRPNFQYSL